MLLSSQTILNIGTLYSSPHDLGHIYTTMLSRETEKSFFASIFKSALQSHGDSMITCSHRSTKNVIACMPGQ